MVVNGPQAVIPASASNLARHRRIASGSRLASDLQKSGRAAASALSGLLKRQLCHEAVPILEVKNLRGPHVFK
jgi:hypothetical protein